MTFSGIVYKGLRFFFWSAKNFDWNCMKYAFSFKWPPFYNALGSYNLSISDLVPVNNLPKYEMDRGGGGWLKKISQVHVALLIRNKHPGTQCYIRLQCIIFWHFVSFLFGSLKQRWGVFFIGLPLLFLRILFREKIKLFLFYFLHILNTHALAQLEGYSVPITVVFKSISKFYDARHQFSDLF